MSRSQRMQRSLPGMLSPRAKVARKEPGRAAPKNEALRAPAPGVSWFTRAREVALGTRFPKVIGGADPYLFGAVVALIVLGVVMVYSASSVRAVRLYGDGHHFLLRQVIYAAIGLPIMLILARFDYHRLRGLGLLSLVVAGGLLLAVVLGAGRNAGGAARWIQVGPINIQPAELTKVALILWLSESLAKKTQKIRSFQVGFLPHVIVVGCLVVLCMAQPDFGSSVILVLLTFVLLFVAGVKLGYMLAGAALILPLVYFALRLKEYRWQRIVAFTDPLKHRMTGGYQIVESWFSFGAGGLTGVGLGDSRQKLLFLPEAHTDFIAAIVAEELGFIGFSLLVLGFVIVILRGLSAAFRAPDDHGLYLGVGLTMFVGLQAVTNLAVVLGLLPTKGLTLPFLSFGGSSLLVNCAAVGILLNVSRPRLRSDADVDRLPNLSGLSLGFRTPASRASNARVQPAHARRVSRKAEPLAALGAERGLS
jgi:cell division protein FtsW